MDARVQERIATAASVGSDDVVVEIGAGLGALTRRLVGQAGQVIAIEHDARLAALLEQEMGPSPGLRVERADALDFDFAAAARAAGRPLVVVVGNLPYQITSPLLFAITDAAAGGRVIGRAILMVQKEFAQRMLAGPGSKVYGRLSVMVQQQAEREIVFHVGPGAFHPRPAVTSTVVRLRPRLTPLAPMRDPAQFAQVVKQAFAARRKMLRVLDFGGSPRVERIRQNGGSAISPSAARSRSKYLVSLDTALLRDRFHPDRFRPRHNRANGGSSPVCRSAVADCWQRGSLPAPTDPKSTSSVYSNTPT